MNEEIVRYEKIYQTMVSLKIKELKAKDLNIDYNQFNDYAFVKGIIPKEIFKELIRRKTNRSHKRSKYKNKIDRMYELAIIIEKEMGIKPKIVFVTMTLNDKNLEIKKRTRVKKIDRWVKKHFSYAIVNEDFGETTGREHYHALALTVEPLEDTGKKSKKGYESYELKNKDYECGFEPNLQIIDYEDKDKMNSYLLKLNNHSNKSSTPSRIRIISKHIYKDFMNIKQKEIIKKRNKNAT